MPSSIEQRLTKLQQQKNDIDQKIKTLKAEKSGELRKRQEKREKLVGKAIYALVTSGTWPVDKLQTLMDSYLVRASDRKLFSLQDTGEKSGSNKDDQSAKIAAKEKQPKRKKEPVATAKKAEASAPMSQTQQGLANSLTQDELMGEFNL